MKRYPLNIGGYVENASNRFSLVKLIILTVISLLLTAALVITTLQAHYTGKALIFCLITFVLIAGYSILNICALARKLKK